MTTLYENYDDEPDDTFLPLPEELACGFYQLEMENFREDVAFYRSVLPKGGRILEMGCGTGRVARQIAGRDRQVIGIDISLPMLRLAALRRSPDCQFLCMDMTAPGFRQAFETIIIPYNTLNLLAEEKHILDCLYGCNEALQAAGNLIVQIFLPSRDLLLQNRATFQFQLFDRPGGGKIIKEILKKNGPGSTLHIEERFRVRPMQQGLANEDYHTTYRIASFSVEKWLVLFARAGFTPDGIWGSYDLKAYDDSPSTCCLCKFSKNN